MKRLIRTKYLTLFCFLAVLAVMFCRSAVPMGEGLRKAAAAYQNTGVLDFSVAEKAYNSAFQKRSLFFITLNGGYQKLMGMRYVNERYKLDNGHLTYVIDEYDMEGIAQNTVAFRDALAELGIPMVYVNTPFKIHRTDKQLPAGVQDHSNENADRFLEYLRSEAVTVLDLRENVEESGLDHYDLFYKTDHHWKAETGLWAAGEIEKFLSGLDAGIGRTDSLLDPSGYACEVHEDIFLGSAGKRVGSLYAGKDDFTVITPKFDTCLSLSAEHGSIRREGTFADVFIVRSNLQADNIFLSNVYSTYCGGGYSHMEIRNQSTQAQAKKLLLIRDSFSDVLVPFLALGYQQLEVLDLRSFEGDLMGYIEAACPDAVLVIYNPGAYEDNNLSMFDFLDSAG